MCFGNFVQVIEEGGKREEEGSLCSCCLRDSRSPNILLERAYVSEQNIVRYSEQQRESGVLPYSQTNSMIHDTCYFIYLFKGDSFGFPKIMQRKVQNE